MSDSIQHRLPTLDDCPCAGTTLDKLIQPAVLLVLAGEPLHGYRIAERIAELGLCGGKPPDSSGVYRYLKIIEGRGYVTATWDLSTVGPARKCYTLTEDGRACLRLWIQTLENYRQDIAALLRAARRSLP